MLSTSIGKIFNAQKQVTPKLKVRSGWNSNSSEILCLSWSSASLMRTRSKMKALSCPQSSLQETFLTLVRVIASIQIWPEIELVRDVMLVLVTCKFDKDLIKMKALSCPYLFRCSRASNSKVNGRIWPKFELI